MTTRNVLRILNRLFYIDHRRKKIPKLKIVHILPKRIAASLTIISITANLCHKVELTELTGLIKTVKT